MQRQGPKGLHGPDLSVASGQTPVVHIYFNFFYEKVRVIITVLLKSLDSWWPSRCWETLA